MNTTYFVNLVANNVLRSTASPAIPTKYYLGFSSTEPKADGGGVKEPSGMGYKRQAVTFGSPSNGVCGNSTPITFPESTGNWGSMKYFVIYDAETGGNLCMGGALQTVRNVEEQTVVTIRENDLKIQVVSP